METIAAGIVPYLLIKDEIYLLLGLEKSNNKWSGFVGGSEKDELIVDTALREFNEETALIFEEYIPFIKSKLNLIVPEKDKSKLGRNVYIYFIQFPDETENKITQFINSKSKLEPNCYHEKSILKWFSLNEIKNSNSKILYRLRQMILKKF